jgi:DNA mismatch repair protein MutS2
MARPVGADVVVKTLANKRGVIIQAAADGRYRVRIEGVTTWCREADLADPPGTAKKKRPGARRDGSFEASPRGRSGPTVRVDLHGLTVDEALARLVSELDRAILNGADRIEVVHGKGTGKVKHAVHRHLASLPAIAAFRLDAHNNGVTWVYL